MERRTVHVAEPGRPAYAKLRNEFGAEFFDAHTGDLNRPKLGNLVFSDAEKRRKLNSILHPAIRWEMFIQVLYYVVFGNHYIVLDTPLLVESGYHNFLWTVIVVWCDNETQLNRLMRRDALTKEDASSQIAAQMPIRKKMDVATILIDNSGSKESLQAKVEAVVQELESRWTPLLVRASVYFFLISCLWLALKILFGLYHWIVI